MPNPTLPCPFCDKTVTRGTALASHIRSAHPKQYSIWRKQKANPSTTAAPKPAQSPAVAAPPKPTSAPASSSGEAPAILLTRAYEQLTERKRAIEEELNRFDDLREELDTINGQVESLKNTVDLFGAGKGSASHSEANQHTEPAGTEAPSRPAASPSTIPFTGNKRELVIAIVKASGSQGVTPKQIDTVFSDRGIQKGRNLIYNTLSLMVQQGKLKRTDGRYSASSSAAGKPTPAKRKLSAAG